MFLESPHLDGLWKTLLQNAFSLFELLGLKNDHFVHISHSRKSDDNKELTKTLDAECKVKEVVFKDKTAMHFSVTDY